jgi:TonB family protein
MAFENYKDGEKKMRIAVLIVIVVSGFVGGFAQKAEKWQILAPANEEFTVEVPVELSYSDDESEDVFPDDKDEAPAREYRNRLKETYFFIFSESRSDDYSPIKTGLDFIRKFDEKGSAISLGSLKGRKYVFGDDEGFYHTAVSIKTKSRTYLFHAVSEDRGNSAADRFIGSVKIEEKKLSQLKASTVPARPADDEKQSEPISIPKRDPALGPPGAVIGGGPAPSDPATLPTHNVIIQSKPRASYTDAARAYDVQGSITLRITLLADGTVGDVTPVSRLPFGLTNGAIAAARTIRFKPAQKDGIAYSKTLTIQYGFTIY